MTPPFLPIYKLEQRSRFNSNLTRLSLELKLDDPTPWDFLLVGDGSGQGWELGAGWGVTAINRLSGERKYLAGGWSSGTISIAELMAYYHGLHFIAENWFEEVKERTARRECIVAVITDSEFLANQFRDQKTFEGPMAPIWAGVHVFMQRGLLPRFRHIPRISLTLNEVADKTASRMRVAAQEEVEKPFLILRREYALDELNPL